MINIKRNALANRISLVLILTVGITLVTLPAAEALDLSTYSFLAVAPNPVGVNQSVTLSMWLSNIPPLDAQGWAIPWKDFNIEVTKPDGTKQTLGPYASDPVGSQWVKYAPNMVGNYTFKLSYTGQTIGSNNYKPSSSNTVVLTVQTQPIEYLPSTPLPEDYWQRPIYAENTQWASISGNWLLPAYSSAYRGTSGFFGDGGAFNPYTTAPETAHVLWTKPIALGGLTGGSFGDINLYTGLTYEGKWAPPIIISGRLYYNTPLGTSSFKGFQCVDIRTGETIWTQNTSSYNNGGPLTLGQLYDYESPNQHGVIPYLWSCHTSTWIMYDAFSGEQILTVANATYGNFALSPKGDVLVYILSGARNWLAMWNSSKLTGMLDGTTGTLAWQWRPRGGSTLDWKTGIQWNVTVPDVVGSQSINQIADVILASTASTSIQQTWVDMAYSASTGEQLWLKNRTALAGDVPLIFGGNFPRPFGEGVYVMFAKETLKWYGFSIATGDALWETEPMTNAWATYPAGGVVAYGKLFVSGYDGTVHCYDIKNGKHLWDYYGGNAGLETPYGHYPFFGGLTVADGKVFAATNEHSPGAPVWKGEKLHAIDGETGKGIWTVSGLWYGSGGGRGSGMGPAVVAEGYLLSVNGNDNQIYCFGKGQTATTVAALPDVSALGSAVLIKGTITDQSPGDTCLGIPLAGTPAIADSIMTDWMEYLYMQQPKPAQATGVKVHITAIDPNNNFQDIGTITSDPDGMFGITWTPPVPGLYKVTASFDGSESYFKSRASTMFAVSNAPAAPIVTPSPAVTLPPTQTVPPTSTPVPSLSTSPTQAVTPPTSAEPTTTYIAIGATVIVVIAVAAGLAIRRRK